MINYKDSELLKRLTINFKYCEHPDANGFTFSIETRGSSGGNCWEGVSTPFKKDSSEILEAIQEKIFSGATDYFHMLNISLSFSDLETQCYSLAEKIIDTAYSNDYQSEYYGNYTEYDKYFISITEVLNLLGDNISTEEKEKVISISNESQEIVTSENNRDNKYLILKDTENKLQHFELNFTKEEEKLKYDLEQSKKQVETLTQKIKNLDTIKLNNFNSLEKTKKEIILFLGEEYINIRSKETIKKKYGH